MSNASQTRILQLYQWLRDETDATHTLSTGQILDRWSDLGISTDRRSVYKDIDTLREFGCDIVLSRGAQNSYYMVNQPFDLAEIKLLIDAVESCQIIPATATKRLVQKLTQLATIHDRENLKRPLITDKSYKTDNDKALRNADVLYSAMNSKQKVAFSYWDYLPTKRKVHKHNGLRYIVSPYLLKWDGDRYYMVGYSDGHGEIKHFRVDRMADLVMLKEKQQKRPSGFNPNKFATKVFGMYGGNEKTVTLLCENEVMKSVIDKFGKNVRTEVVDDEHFKVVVDVEPSPPFFGWVFQFEGKIQIIGPTDISKKLKEMLNHFN